LTIGKGTVQRRQFLAYLGCSFSIGVFSSFNNFTLTLWLANFTTSYLLLGLLGNSKSFEGAIVSPLTGAWSDRVWAGWLGRRRPFILVGGLLAALLLALTPTISRWPLPSGLGWLPAGIAGLAPAILAIFLFTLAFNSMDDIHKALLAEVAGPLERNALSALSVVVDMAGEVIILVVGFLLWKDSVPDAAFVITGGLVAVGALITVAGVREPGPAVWEARREQRAAVSRPRQSRRAALADYRGAVVFCLVIFAYWAGVNAVMPLVSVYTRDILGATIGEAQLLPALMLLTTTLLAVPMGYLGNRFGKRRVISAGYAIMACAALAGLVITTKEQGAVLFLVAGVGNAASMVLTIPLLADLVPRHSMGMATGALAASGSLAAPLSSLAAGALSDLYGPRAIFALMGAMVLIALLLMPAVRRPAAGLDVMPPALLPAA
jgi:maltose/moltooligosaccharide transporter